MMFQRKIKEFCQEFHDMIGKNRIKECFLADTDFHSESFVMKPIKCLSDFICEQYSAKPWNRCNQFGQHIKPKKNITISLKDHQFNRLQGCCLSLMYHLDDIADYLNANLTIINDVAILDRSFIEMELLKPIYGAIALLGLHITRPFHTLLIDPSTTYSTLMVSFKRLYKDLTEIPAKNFLTKDQAAYFVTKDIYEKSKPDECLLQFIEESIKAFSSEIEKLIAIALPKFASSFNTQKGAIFGFGPSAELEPTGNVLKLCNTDSNTLDKLDTHVQIHNLAQE